MIPGREDTGVPTRATPPVPAAQPLDLDLNPAERLAYLDVLLQAARDKSISAKELFVMQETVSLLAQDQRVTGERLRALITHRALKHLRREGWLIPGKPGKPQDDSGRYPLGVPRRYWAAYKSANNQHDRAIMQFVHTQDKMMEGVFGPAG